MKVNSVVFLLLRIHDLVNLKSCQKQGCSNCKGNRCFFTKQNGKEQISFQTNELTFTKKQKKSEKMEDILMKNVLFAS